MRALAALFLLLALGARAETLAGYVVSITDGDTIVVLDAERKQHKIRLAGIDAPEEHQPFGERSKQNIATLTFNKTVTVEWRKTHRERLVGKVMVGGVDANLAQVRASMAWWYEKYRRSSRRPINAFTRRPSSRPGHSGSAYGETPHRWRRGTGGMLPS